MKNSIYILSLLLVLASCKKDDPSPQETSPLPILSSEFPALANLFDGNGIGAAINLHEDVLLLFNMDGDRYAWFEDNEIKATYDLSYSNGPMGSVSLNSIGAGVIQNNSSSAYFFDTSGGTYTVGSFDNDNTEGHWDDPQLFTFSAVFDLTIYGPDNTCPFDGIGAARPLTFAGTDCFDAQVNENHIIMFNMAGDQFVWYSFSDGGLFHNVVELDNWFAENNCGGPDGILPFDAISACCRYVTPARIQEIFFSEDGMQFCYYSVSEGVFSEVYDLY